MWSLCVFVWGVGVWFVGFVWCWVFVSEEVRNRRREKRIEISEVESFGEKE